MSESREPPAEPVAPSAAEAQTVSVEAVADVPPASPAVATEAAEPPQTETPPVAPLENLLSGAPTEAPPAAEPPPAPLAEPPAPYEWQPFALPEDLAAAQLDEARIGALREALTAPDLSPQERGQKLLDLHLEELRSYDERTLNRQIETFQEMQRGWIDAFKGDPEIGGAAAQTHLALANAAIRRFAREDQRFGRPLPAAQNGERRESDHSALMDAMRVIGAVNHPEIVRYFARVEQFLREPARAAPAIGPSAVPRDIGQRRPGSQGGNPGRGQARMRDMYDHERSQETFNGTAR